MSQHDLLLGVANTVYAVDCHVDKDTLHCGGLYIEPGLEHSVIRLSDNTASIDVTLPDELLHQEEPIRLWGTHLELTQPQS